MLGCGRCPRCAAGRGHVCADRQEVGIVDWPGALAEQVLVRASSLYRLWHSIQDIKEDAQHMNDEELALLVGMIELLVEERAAGLGRRGAALAGADTTRPN